MDRQESAGWLWGWRKRSEATEAEVSRSQNQSEMDSAWSTLGFGFMKPF